MLPHECLVQTAHIGTVESVPLLVLCKSVLSNWFYRLKNMLKTSSKQMDQNKTVLASQSQEEEQTLTQLQ